MSNPVWDRERMTRYEGTQPWTPTERNKVLGAVPDKGDIVIVTIPQLRDVPPYKTERISFNRRVAHQFQHAFDLIEELGLTGYILTYDGAYNYRQAKGGSFFSDHAYGCAIDLNAAWNGWLKKPAARGSKGSLHELAGVFESCGIGWGGAWTRQPDGMHFSINRIIPAGELPVLASMPDADELAERRRQYQADIHPHLAALYHATAEQYDGQELERMLRALNTYNGELIAAGAKKAA